MNSLHRFLHLLHLVLLFQLAACSSPAPVDVRRARVELGTTLGRFTSATIDAYCRAIEDQIAEAGPQAAQSDLTRYASHGLTCREMVLRDFASTPGRPLPSDPRILEAIGLELLHASTDYATGYDAARVAAELVYDESAAAECLADLTARGLDWQLLRLLPACRRVFDGKTPLGADCADDGECAGDAYCGPAIEADDTCTHSVCIARSPEGSPCTFREASCSAGSEIGVAHCTLDSAPTCRIARVPVGLGLGESCAVTADAIPRCAPGLQCMITSDLSDEICAKPFELGERCDRSDGGSAACVRGTVCRFGPQQATCVPEHLVTRAGAACGETNDSVETCDALSRLFCNSQGKCANIGSGDANAPCRRKLSAFDCDVGLRCAVDEGPLGRCVPEQQPVAGLHMGCIAGVDWTPTCAPGLVCATDFESGISSCEPYPLAAGMRCGPGAGACAEGLACRSSALVPPYESYPAGALCAPPLPDGSSCGWHDDCASGVCRKIDGRCGASQPGGICSLASDCASGRCERGFCVQTVTLNDVCGPFLLCPEGYYCGTSGGGALPLCTPTLDLDSACIDPSQCTSGRCDDVSGTCQAPEPIGASCAKNSSDCGPNPCLDSLDAPGVYQCVATPLDDGRPCSLASDCASGVCGWNAARQARFCRQPAADGSVCFANSECVSDLCVYDELAQHHVCSPRLPDRESCTSDAQCESGTCHISADAPRSLFQPTYGRCGDWADVCFARAITASW